MKLIKVVCLALMLSACGKKEAVVDPELSEYAMRFEREMGVTTEGINMGFGSLKSPSVGLCSIKNGEVRITIDRAFWDTIGEEQREHLMYHELGHCAMGLDHDNSIMGNNCPKSMMYPYLFVNCYLNHRDYYISELRSK